MAFEALRGWEIRMESCHEQLAGHASYWWRRSTLGHDQTDAGLDQHGSSTRVLVAVIP